MDAQRVKVDYHVNRYQGDVVVETELVDTTRVDYYDGAKVDGFYDRHGWSITITYADGGFEAWAGHGLASFETTYREACQLAENA